MAGTVRLCPQQSHLETQQSFALMHTLSWKHGQAKQSKGLAAWDPTLGLTLCCCHPEILNNFVTRGPAFPFYNEPHNYGVGPHRSLASGQLPVSSRG